MRHYEILGNYCIPWFIGLEECPQGTLNAFPKDAIIQARNLTENFDDARYYSIMDELFEHTKNHLTTLALAKYVVSKI